MGIRANRQRGQVLVVFAITLTGLLAVIGLLYSFGLVLTQRRSLQAAADAASLGGSWVVLQELASDNRDDSKVWNSVVGLANCNGVPLNGTPLGTATTTETGTTATYRVANSLTAGQTVNVAGCLVSSYSGANLVVTSATSTSFTVTRPANLPSPGGSFAVSAALPVATTSISAFYVDGNGVDVSPSAAVGSGVLPGAARGVRVSVSNTIPTVLPGFVKVVQIFMQDSATATSRPTVPPQMTLVIPIAVSSAKDGASVPFQLQTTYDLFAHPVTGTLPPTLDLAGGANPAPSYGSRAVNMQAWSDGAHTGPPWQMPLGNVNLTGPITATTTETANIATYTVANNLQAGQTISVTGCSVAGYNGTNLVVQSASPSSFTVALATSGLAAGTNALVPAASYYDGIAAGLQTNLASQGLTDSSGRAYGIVLVPVYTTFSAATTPPTVSIVGFAEFKILSSAISPTSVSGIFVPYAAAASPLGGTQALPLLDFGAGFVSIVS